jgi:hypothetical protein
MTVKKLIEELQKFPENTKVKIMDESGMGNITAVYETDLMHDNAVVVIE